MTIFRTNFRGLSNAAEQKLKPKIGHLFSNPAHFKKNPSCRCDPKARAFWRWSNYLQARSAPGRPLVVINIDETNVKLVPQERAGHVSKRAYRLFVRGRPMGRNASLSAQRSTITHVAAMCDRADIQTLLPQVVLVGANQLSEERLDRIRMAAPACVDIWRYPKAWVSNAVMVRYIRLLGRRLRKYRRTYLFSYVDVLKAHICPAVLRAASAANIWICVVPARMAWVLQPCDTHLFARYKQMLTEDFQRRSGLTSAGEISWELMLESLWHVILVLLQGRDWSQAFAAVGILDGQAHLSKRTQSKLSYERPPPLEDSSLPTLSDFEVIFPKSVSVPIHELFLPIERFLRGLDAEEVVLMDEVHDNEAVVLRLLNPWFGRTRSTSAQAHSVASSSAERAHPWTPLEPNPPPPMPPPLEPPSTSATAASSSQCPAQVLPHRRLPMGRRLPAPRRSSSLLLETSAPVESPPPDPAAPK